MPCSLGEKERSQSALLSSKLFCRMSFWIPCLLFYGLDNVVLLGSLLVSPVHIFRMGCFSLLELLLQQDENRNIVSLF